MYSTQTFLTRRKPQTIKIYKRSLVRFAEHVGSTLDTLHEYLERTEKEKLTGDLLTFADTLSKMGQNTQRVTIASVMSYLGYNDIIVPKSQRGQIVPKKGDFFRDKALKLVEVKKVYEYLSPIGRMTLLLLFSTGVRIGEAIQIREGDVEGKVIHLKSSYTKTSKERDVIMSSECQKFMNEIWLPQKQAYLNSAVNRNRGLVNQSENPERRAKVKKLTDDRILPMSQSTAYTMLMLAFKNAGFDAKKDDKNLYHPHGLRKSFRSVVGSQNVDLAEKLMGHAGYLSESYVRIDDEAIEAYEKIEGLLTLSGNGGNGRVAALEEENAELKAQYADVTSRMSRMEAQFTRILLAVKTVDIDVGKIPAAIGVKE